jgi:hypothetical protein
VPIGRLSSLQERVLVLVADVTPPWTLTGGGALVGFHTKHRDTRDLDLFFRPQGALGEAVTDVRQRLEHAGLSVAILRSSPSFTQLEVRDDTGSVVVDLVADPTPIADPPRPTDIGDRSILVETPHQLLVNKLCALLSRSELRDLVDVRALLAAEGDLHRALQDCPRQDGGFSPLTFAWCVRGIPLPRLARALGWPESDVVELDRFRDELVDRVLTDARPEG